MTKIKFNIVGKDIYDSLKTLRLRKDQKLDFFSITYYPHLSETPKHDAAYDDDVEQILVFDMPVLFSFVQDYVSDYTDMGDERAGALAMDNDFFTLANEIEETIKKHYGLRDAAWISNGDNFQED